MRNIRFRKIFPFLLIALIGSVGSLRAEIRPEAGFVSLDPNAFYFHNSSYFNRIALLSSPARMWYVCQPADTDPGSNPLFVFFNGGPGSATSCGLLGAFTGRNAVVRDETAGTASVAPNPHSWTRLGNLLHIDARATGFSYGLTDDPSDADRRRKEFDAQNFNAFTDGADFLRVVLRFLASHPDIRANPVVLVPESYGGIRTIVMLHILLYYEDYANGRTVYQNPDLVREIRDHYAVVFPEYRGRTVPPEVVARQFGHQVMIQTIMAPSYQRSVAVDKLEAPGSPLFQIAGETSVPYIPYQSRPGANQNPAPSQIMNYIYGYLDAVGRDPYHIAKPAGFLDGHRKTTLGFLTQIQSLNQLIGVDARSIPEMYASYRSQAYKSRLTSDGASNFSAWIGPLPRDERAPSSSAMIQSGGLEDVFGNLRPWDGYFLNTNWDVNAAFSWNQVTLREYDITHGTSLLYGRMFLETVAWVETYATDAAWDVVVYTPALTEALARYTTILSGARLDRSGSPKTPRPGKILLDYRATGVPGFSGSQRSIRFPRYGKSGHAVTMTEPGEILEDVAAWLASTGIPVSPNGEIK